MLSENWAKRDLLLAKALLLGESFCTLFRLTPHPPIFGKKSTFIGVETLAGRTSTAYLAIKLNVDFFGCKFRVSFLTKRVAFLCQ